MASLRRMSGIILLMTFFAPVGAIAAPGAESEDRFAQLRCDPTQVMGVDSCLKCHEKEIQQWQQTPHHATFESLHRSPEAKAIADKLGLRSVKRNETCIKCHYTSQEVDGKNRIIAGVSCESCHGAARDWITLHSDYGGENVTREMESPGHRRDRIDSSTAAGMNNPDNLYLIARQCLSCHTSPDEKLVNVGGHPPGTEDFELVSWSQGIVRHNFLRGGGHTNQPSSPERRRVMFVVGILADLEASLRATATATEKATFGMKSAQRAARQKKRLYEIAQLVDNSQVQEALQAAMAVRLKLNNQEELEGAADRVGQAAFEFAGTNDGSDLQALDPMIPTEASYKR